MPGSNPWLRGHPARLLGKLRAARAAIVAVCAAAGIAGAVIAPVAAQASTAPRASAVASHSVSAAMQKATIAYWTPQRRADAISADIVTTRASTLPRPAIVHPGKAGSVRGGLPARAIAGRAAATLTGQAASYPFPYSSFYVPASDYTLWPYELNGKIFFTNNGVNYVCSGTSVASYHGTSLENEVWTAGHCVSNTSRSSPGVWDSFAEFIPAYNGNSSNYAPFGIFVASRFETATSWLNSGDFSVDEGAMEVGTNSAGRTLGQAVGWDGFAWNYSSTESFTTFGYPAASPYNGTSMVEDIASTGTTVNMGGVGQPAIGIGSPMTGGSSGGAWNIFWSTSGPGYINGHNDFKFSSQPLAMYSPYQDTLANQVRCFGASSC